MNDKRIGELNGSYSIMFRVALLTYPFLLLSLSAFCTWVVMQLHDLDLWRASTASNRFTSQDWMVAKAIIDDRHSITDKRIFVVEEAVKATTTAAIAAKDNSAANKIMLEAIKAELEKP